MGWLSKGLRRQPSDGWPRAFHRDTRAVLAEWHKVAPHVVKRESFDWIVYGWADTVSCRVRLEGAPLEWVQGYVDAAGERRVQFHGLLMTGNGFGDMVLEGKYFGTLPDYMRDEMKFWLRELEKRALALRATGSPWHNADGVLSGIYFETRKPTKAQLATITR